MEELRTYYYEADGGLIMLGNESFRACFPNCYGDGCFKVTVTDSEVDHSKYKFIGSVEGSGISVYSYDCLDDRFDAEENILCKLNGRYGVFAKHGDIILQRWN